MVSILDCAFLAEAAYDEGGTSRNPAAPQTIKGLRPLVFKKNEAFVSGGFQATVYRVSGSLVIAFKGTELTKGVRQGIGDLSADVKLAIGMNTQQFADGEDLVVDTRKRFPDLPIAVCGHSLGGAIAQIIGNRHKVPFCTFNAPGVALFSRNIDQMAESFLRNTFPIRIAGAVASAARHPLQAVSDIKNAFYWVRGVNYHISGDIVSQVGVHYGARKALDGKGITNLKELHSMKFVIELLQNSTTGALSLDSVV